MKLLTYTDLINHLSMTDNERLDRLKDEEIKKIIDSAITAAGSFYIFYIEEGCTFENTGATDGWLMFDPHTGGKFPGTTAMKVTFVYFIDSYGEDVEYKIDNNGNAGYSLEFFVKAGEKVDAKIGFYYLPSIPAEDDSNFLFMKSEVGDIFIDVLAATFYKYTMDFEKYSGLMSIARRKAGYLMHQRPDGLYVEQGKIRGGFV